MVDFMLKGLVIAACFVAAVVGGTPPVRALIRRIERPTPASAPSPAPATPGEASDVVPGLAQAEAEMPGGYWLGLLERAALYACVLAGFPAGIAVVLGVKSIGRYPELRTPTGSKGELFIIGTFASMLWAAAWAGLAHGLVRLW